MGYYINKIYDKIKKYIKENFISLIILIIFVFACFYDTGYSIYKPGGTIDATKRVSGDNLYSSKGSFNMAYVSMMEGRLIFYLAAKVIPSWELIKNDDLTTFSDEDMSDVLARDNLYYKEAQSNAMYVAFKEAGIDYEIVNNNYYVILKTDNNDSELKIGDELISYDDMNFNGIDEFKVYINSKEVGNKIKIKYLRETEEKETYSTIYQEEDNNLYLGLGFVNILDIKTDYNIEVASKNSESGPSGGLITTLAIYNAITKEDITHGRKIVGTGTISADGTVGEIGSVTYKLAAAVKSHADIFLCPKENFEEALNYAEEKKYKILIKDIETFDEAIKYLNTLEEN